MSIVICDMCDCNVNTDYPDEIVSDETGRTICARCCEKMFDTPPPISGVLLEEKPSTDPAIFAAITCMGGS